MKEKIYTIPINDAFDENTECAVCAFLKKEEKDRIEYALGDSMMQPDERIIGNEKGYCNRHTEMMFEFGNKLSHALILETRLDYLEQIIKKTEEKLNKPKKAVFGKSKFKEDVDNTFSKTNEAISGCVICSRLDDIMKIFTENLFFMYKSDDEFKNKIFNSKGFCMHHFMLLVNSAPSYLNTEDAYEFIKKLCALQKENISRVKEDVSWFTKKFDYRFKDESWKNSRDAVPRGCEKTAMYMNVNWDNE